MRVGEQHPPPAGERAPPAGEHLTVGWRARLPRADENARTASTRSPQVGERAFTVGRRVGDHGRSGSRPGTNGSQARKIVGRGLTTYGERELGRAARRKQTAGRASVQAPETAGSGSEPAPPNGIGLPKRPSSPVT